MPFEMKLYKIQRECSAGGLLSASQRKKAFSFKQYKSGNVGLFLQFFTQKKTQKMSMLLYLLYN